MDLDQHNLVNLPLPIWPVNHSQCIDARNTKSCAWNESDIKLSVGDNHDEDFVVRREASDFCCNVKRWQHQVPFNDYIEEVSAGKRFRELGKAQINFIHSCRQAIKS